MDLASFNLLICDKMFCLVSSLEMLQTLVTNPILHATAKPVQFKDPNEILQVHLAQGQDSSEMV